MLRQRVLPAIRGAVLLPEPYACGPPHGAHAFRLDPWRAPCISRGSALSGFDLLRMWQDFVYAVLVLALSFVYRRYQKLA
jgi:hypothetical protein